MIGDLLQSSRLYTFVDLAYLDGKDPLAVARELCAGGSDVVQLRAKGFSETRILELARSIRTITRDAGVALVINDHPWIAAEVGAELCHLGQEDFFDAGFTRCHDVLPASNVVVGLSTHAPAQAERALASKPAYIAIGPVFATPTKPTAAPVTLEYVRWAAENVAIPWFAIGGITLQNLDEVVTAGGRRICVVSAILNAPDIAHACQQFKERLMSTPL
jgi:thiamine-phosphate pyrophosphorylase